MADSVQLTDLDVITRYSIAVRTATADRDELIQTLRADLNWLEADRRGRSTRIVEPDPDVDDVDDDQADEEYVEAPARLPIRRMPASVRTTPPPRRAAPKKAAAKKAAAKTTTRRTAR